MDDNKFEFNEEQKRLCHELTMEYLRQNEVFKRKRDDNGKLVIQDGEMVRNVYFNVYEEIAIGIIDNWNRIQRMYH